MVTGSLSKRYARALTGYCQAHDLDTESLAQELRIISKLLSPGAGLHTIFTNKLIPSGKKAEILDRIINKSRISPVISSFLRLLMSKDRIILLPEIYRDFRLLADDLQGIIRGEVIVATDLPEETIGNLKVKLGNLMNKKVMLTVKRDPSIIGGLIVKVGSLSFNGSIRSQLNNMRKNLIEGVTL